MESLVSPDVCLQLRFRASPMSVCRVTLRVRGRGVCMEKVRSLAVVDVETTGLGNMDRVVEVAAVLLDPLTLETIDEFDSLINPLRDVGPTRIHGVTASMVSAAPTFEEVAAHLGSLLSGSLLVAHNLPFDSRFLANEFKRADGQMDVGIGLCTLRATRQTLQQACSSLSIDLLNAHRALADARACAELLRRLAAAGMPLQGIPAHVQTPSAGVVRTLRRDMLGDTSLPLHVPPYRFAFPSSDDAELSYLYMLDRYLDDGSLSGTEKQDLRRLAEVNAIEAAVPALHQAYVAAVAGAAWRDGVLSDAERTYLKTVARELEVGLELPQDEPVHLAVEVTVGVRVCFTGEPVVDGCVLSREYLTGLALRHGLVAVESVTKKSCDLLVCADTATMSGKAKKAHSYGIPVIDAAEFLRRVEES